MDTDAWPRSFCTTSAFTPARSSRVASLTVDSEARPTASDHGATSTDGGDHRGRLRPTRCQPDSLGCTPKIGRPEKNERPHPPAAREDTQSIIMCPGHQPADLGKPGCLIATTVNPHRSQRKEDPRPPRLLIRSPIIHSRAAIGTGSTNLPNAAPTTPLRRRTDAGKRVGRVIVRCQARGAAEYQVDLMPVWINESGIRVSL